MAINETPFPQPFRIKQTAAAGSNLNGALPTSTRTFSDNVVKYASQAGGGKIDPHYEVGYINRKGTVINCDQIYLGMDGNQSTWTISVVDADGLVMLWASGTTEGEQRLMNDDCPRLLFGEWIKVVTTGSPVAGIPVTAMFSPVRKGV